MEIVYSHSFNNLFLNDQVNNFYGDIKDLMNLGIKIEGIIYDDEWRVKRFLGFFKNKKRINSILSYLELDESILDKRIKDLGKTDLKWVLLAYAILNHFEYIVFEYFDTSLIYKDKKKFMNIVNKLIQDEFKVIVISKDFELMFNLNKNIYIMNDNELINMEILKFISKYSSLIELPPIVEFIKLANKKHVKLEMTLDSKELIKDIYRRLK